MNIKHIIYFVLLASVPSAAEDKIQEVQIYSCKTKTITLPPDVFLIPSEYSRAEGFRFRVFYPDHNLGKIALPHDSFEALWLKAKVADQSKDPFFGSGDFYILKCDGKEYVLFLEKSDQPNSKLIGRCGVGIATRLNHSGDVITANPFAGAIRDEAFLSSLVRLVYKSSAVQEPDK